MSEKIVSRSVYFTVCTVLMVLTAVTVLVARVDLGPFNTVVALTIAIVKVAVGRALRCARAGSFSRKCHRPSA